MKNTVVIPAAGVGRRMRSLGPKALLRFGKETIVRRQIRLVEQCLPGWDIVVVAGFEADRVFKAFDGRGRVRVVVNLDYASTNVAKSIAVGLEEADGDAALVVYGDLVFNPATLLPFQRPPGVSAAVVDRQSRPEAAAVGATVVDGAAHRFGFGLPSRWCQVVYLTAADARTFVDYASCRRRWKYFGHEVLNHLLEGGADMLAVHPPGMQLAEVDSVKDLDAAKENVEQ